LTIKGLDSVELNELAKTISSWLSLRGLAVQRLAHESARLIASSLRMNSLSLGTEGALDATTLTLARSYCSRNQFLDEMAHKASDPVTSVKSSLLCQYQTLFQVAKQVPVKRASTLTGLLLGLGDSIPLGRVDVESGNGACGTPVEH
jgi:hypothetical protein